MIETTKLDLSDLKRLLIIGDLHGNYRLLLKAYEELNYKPKFDSVISCGDTIDRGDQSFESAFHFCHNENNYAVLGNHEDMLIKGTLEADRVSAIDHLYNGGLWTHNYAEGDIKAISEMIARNYHLILKVKFGNLDITISHADIPNHNPDWIENSMVHNILWNHKAHRQDFTVKNTDISIHGHKILKEPQLNKNRLFIDTGAGLTNFDEFDLKGGLTCVEVTKTSVDLHRFYMMHNGKVVHQVTPSDNQTLKNIRALIGHKLK